MSVGQRYITIGSFWFPFVSSNAKETVKAAVPTFGVMGSEQEMPRSAWPISLGTKCTLGVRWAVYSIFASHSHNVVAGHSGT
jgi:hypothetical protein